MALQVAILASALAFFLQQPARIVEVGTILEVSSREIQVKTPVRTVAFRVTADTEVYERTPSDGLTALRTGDLVSVHGSRDASGAAVATAISARRATVRATVQKVNRSAGEILVGSDSGNKAGGSRTIRYYPCTVFGAPENALNPGAEVLVVGLELRDGGVDAARITIYHTDLPARRAR